MKRNCLIVFIWLVGFCTLSAQWTPDIATLNYKTGLNEDSTSTRAHTIAEHTCSESNAQPRVSLF